MRYHVNAQCTKCGRRFSYWSDDDPAVKVCPVPHELTERELVAMPREELPFDERSTAWARAARWPW